MSVPLLADAPTPRPTLALRDYQRSAIDAAYAWHATHEGHCLLVVPTGGGKSLIMGTLAAEAVAGGARVLVVAHRKELIEQNWKALQQAGLPTYQCGIISGQLGRKDRTTPATVASIQTIARNPYAYGPFDLILIDEAHLTPRSEDTSYRKYLQAAHVQRPTVRCIGLTATPYRLDSGRLDVGEDRVFDEIAYEITIQTLLDGGYLCPLISKATLARYDVTGVAMRGGEYVESALQAAVDDPATTAAVIDELATLAANRRRWLLFCAGVQHAEHMAEALTAAGYPAAAVHGELSNQDRASRLAALRAGTLRALTNCDVLCLDEETEILTSAGWVGIDAMTEQHDVANFDAETSRIWFSPPKLIVRRPRRAEEPMVVLDGPYRSVRVTGNHRMLHTTSRTGSFTIAQARTLVGKGTHIPVAGFAEPHDIGVEQEPPMKSSTARRVQSMSYHFRSTGMTDTEARATAEERVAAREALRFKQPQELSFAECRFIGFFFGDGSLHQKVGGGMVCAFSQSKVYKNVITWFDGVLADMSLAVPRYEHPERGAHGVVTWHVPRGTGFGPQQRSGYYPLTPYLVKSGPRSLLAFTADQLLALWEGLVMADGLHGTAARDLDECTWRVTSTQRGLLELLQEVFVQRGYDAKVTSCPAPTKANHAQQWRLFVRRGYARQWLAHRRFALEMTPWREERVWCVTSESGNLVTRRRGTVTIMGNTTGYDEPSIDLLALCRPTASTGLHVQMLGRGFRIAPGKENCLVLDFAGNCFRHGPVDAVRVRDPKKKSDQAAPAKTCPTCQEIVGTATRVCPACGHGFPPPAPVQLAPTAHLSPVMAREKGPVQWHDVTSVEFSRHVPRDPKKRDTLRADYKFHFQRVATEWICVEHEGFARQKAEQWWQDHLGGTCPATIDAALDIVDQLEQPVAIALEPDGQYDRVVNRRFTDAPAMVRAAAPSGLPRACWSCLHFDALVKHCHQWQADPPDDVQRKGCDAWSDEEVLPF